MTVDAIREAIGVKPGTDSTRIQGKVHTDSRLIETGDVFVALPGENTDGHHFLGSVARRGGQVAITSVDSTRIVESGWATKEELGRLILIQVEDTQYALGQLARAHLLQLRRKSACGNGALNMVVGITGSAGKTTTKDLTRLLLSTLGPTVAPQGSYNNEIGLPLTVLLADTQTKYLILEMGASKPGDLKYLCDIAPLDIAAVLMVGTAHLESYESPESLAAEKSSILENLGPNGTALLNADDARVEAMSGRTSGRLLYFSATKSTPVQASRVRLNESSQVSFDLTLPSGQTSVSLQLIGRHHLSNALAAAAIAHLAGLAPADIAAVLNQATPQSEHRMNMVHLADRVDLIDDAYNANPDSMRAALDVLEQYSHSRRVIAILGDMMELGETSPQLHGEIGRYVASLNLPVLFGVGSMSKNIVSAYSALKRDGEYHHTSDEHAALRLLQEIVHPGDLILIKGSHGSNLWKLAQTIEERGRVR